MGVEVHTERLWQRADREGLARLVFVNMLDRERADFFRALDSLQAAFGNHVVATEIPIGSEHEVRGVIDLIDMKAFTYEGSGRGNAPGGRDPRGAARPGRGVPREADGRGRGELRRADGALPRGRGDRPRGDRHRAQAAASPTARSSRSPAASRPATSAPTACSTALVEDLPSPAMRGPVTALDADGEEIEIAPDEDGRAGRLRLQDARRPLRRPDQPLPRLSRDAALRLPGRQRHASGEGADRPAARAAGQGAKQVDELGAGDIGAVAKLKETRAGDVLCASRTRDLLPAARPARAGDGVRLSSPRRRATRRRRRPRCAG